MLWTWTSLLLFLSMIDPVTVWAEATTIRPRPSMRESLDRLRQAAKAAKLRDAGDDIYAPPKDSSLAFMERILVRSGETAVPALLPWLDEPDLRISEAAADVLQRICSKAAQDAVIAYSLRHLLDTPRMTKRLTGPGYERLRDIGRPMLPAITKAFDRLSRAPCPSDEASLLISLAASIPDRAGVPLLEKAVEHADPTLSAAAAEELVSIDGAGAFTRLIQYLERDRSAVCRRGPGRHAGCASVVRALAGLRNPDAVEPLLNLLLRLGPPPWERLSTAAETNGASCQHEAEDAIDKLTGQKMGGEIQRIRTWVAKYRQRAPTVR